MKQLESLGRVLVTDVLVVGGGIAGLATAISAKEANPDASVLVVDKATPGWGGKANKGGANLSFLLPGDSVDDFVKFRVENVGCYLEDQVMTRDFISSTYDVLQRAESWGVLIYHSPDGGYLNLRWGEEFPWRVGLTDLDITLRMLRHAKKLGVEFVDHVAMVDLLKDEDHVAGAVGFSVIDGAFYIVDAQAVVLANGNQNYRIMPRWASGRGDGIAAAYRAGAEMRNAEFGSFINWVFADTKEVCQGAEDVLYNAKGESISKEVRPRREADVHSKEVVAWYKAILAGDGPVYVNMDENRFNQEIASAFHTDRLAKRPFATEFWGRTIAKAEAGATREGPLQEIMPGLIAEQSPVRIDRNAATTVPGLFAVGDTGAAGSAWAGAVPAPPGRLRGGALMFAMWTGMRAGAAAADLSKPGPARGVDAAQVAMLRERIFAPLDRPDGTSPVVVQRAVQDVMGPVGNSIYKHGERLTAALERIGEIKRSLPELKAKDWHYLSACNEVGAMVNSAEMFFRASLLRDETRGWHIREDRPERDDANWLKWIIVKDVDGEMSLTTEDIPIESYPFRP